MNTCVLDYVAQSIEGLEKRHFLLETHCPACNQNTPWKREVRIRKFPKHLRINFDAEGLEINDRLPVILEQEISLGHLSDLEDVVDNTKESADGEISRVPEMQESRIQGLPANSTIMMRPSFFDTLTFGLLRKKVLPPTDQIAVMDNRPIINPNHASVKPAETYQLTSFAVMRFNPSKLKDELVSYIRTKGTWLEMTASEVKSIKFIERILQSPLKSLVYANYVRKTQDIYLLETGDLEKAITESQPKTNPEEKAFCIPGNFNNTFLHLDRLRKVSLTHKFCEHSLLKPSIKDVFSSISLFIPPKIDTTSSEDARLPPLLSKYIDRTDGSDSALKYLANSTEVPFSLAKKVLDSPSQFYLNDSADWKRVCGDCLVGLRDTTVRRIFEKAILFNCLKTAADSTEKGYLIESTWFQSYRDYLLPDLKIFGLKASDTLGRLPPTAPMNASIKQKLMVSSAKGESDDKIAARMFVRVNRKCFAFLQFLYKSENCVIFSQKRIYVDNSESIDTDILFTVQEQSLLDQLKSSYSAHELDQPMKTNLWKVNKKVNLLFEMAIDSYFKPVLSGLDLPRSAIDAHLSNTLAKFTRSFRKSQPDFKWFDPCKIIFNILNNGKIDMSFQREPSFAQTSKARKTSQRLSSGSKCALVNSVQFEDRILNSNLFEAEASSEWPGQVHANGEVKRTSGSDNRATRTTETLSKSAQFQNKLALIQNGENQTLENPLPNGDRIIGDAQAAQDEPEWTNQMQLFFETKTSQSPRDSISMILHKDNELCGQKSQRKNMANIYKNANPISILNNSVVRETIQLNDSINPSSVMMSFFSSNDSQIETIPEFTDDAPQEEPETNAPVQGPLDSLPDLVQNEAETQPKKDPTEDHDGQAKDDDFALGDSRVYNKSRFCKYQGDQGLNQSYAEIDFEGKNPVDENGLCPIAFGPVIDARSKEEIVHDRMMNWQRSLSIEKVDQLNIDLAAMSHVVSIVHEMKAVCAEIREESLMELNKLARYNIHQVFKAARNHYIKQSIVKPIQQIFTAKPEVNPTNEEKSTRTQFQLNIIKDSGPQKPKEIINLASRKSTVQALGVFELTEAQMSQVNYSSDQSMPTNPFQDEASNSMLKTTLLDTEANLTASNIFPLKEIRISNMLTPLSEQSQFFERMSDGLLDTKLIDFEKMLGMTSKGKEGKENAHQE